MKCILCQYIVTNSLIQPIFKKKQLFIRALDIRNNEVPFNKFMMAAGDLKLRGTGSILRFNKNLKEYLYAKG